MENQERTVRCARSRARLVGYFSDVRLPGMKEVNSQGAKKKLKKKKPRLSLRLFPPFQRASSGSTNAGQEEEE